MVELGAGIGRFTADLAVKAKSVIALDFMQKLIDQNEAANSHLGNIEFRCGDATQLDLPERCADILFSNWLLMYLSDAEVEKIANNFLRWLDDDGVVFFRESCFRQSGDRSRASNPTHYRNPREYFRIFDNAKNVRSDGAYERFELVCCKSVDTYVRVKQNQNQVCWKWRKVVTPSVSSTELRHFLDSQQYTNEGIVKYQMIFGDGFVSPGGIESTEEFSKMLDVSTDDSVLDLGCGVGGAAFFIARKVRGAFVRVLIFDSSTSFCFVIISCCVQYGCYVYGVDLSVNMIMCALESAAASGNGDKVSFEVSDASKRELPGNSYDAVFSRDAFFYVGNKAALLKKIFKVMKPGGRLVITDYCAGSAETVEFKTYVSERSYHLASIEEYESLLRDAGFEVKMIEDRSSQLLECIDREIKKVDSDEDKFTKELGPAVVENLRKSWRKKSEFVKNKDHKWGLFVAVKPE